MNRIKKNSWITTRQISGTRKKLSIHKTLLTSILILSQSWTNLQYNYILSVLHNSTNLWGWSNYYLPLSKADCREPHLFWTWHTFQFFILFLFSYTLFPPNGTLLKQFLRNITHEEHHFAQYTTAVKFDSKRLCRFNLGS